MNKLTVTLMIGLMSCALCGCMSEQEIRQQRYAIVENLLSEHPEWDEKIRDGIRNEYIVRGMTPKQLEWALWGGSEYAVRNGVIVSPGGWGAWGGRELWLVDEDSWGNIVGRASWWQHGRLGTMYFFFRGGRLDSWSWSDVNLLF